MLSHVARKRRHYSEKMQAPQGSMAVLSENEFAEFRKRNPVQKGKETIWTGSGYAVLSPLIPFQQLGAVCADSRCQGNLEAGSDPAFGTCMAWLLRNEQNKGLARMAKAQCGVSFRFGTADLEDQTKT